MKGILLAGTAICLIVVIAWVGLIGFLNSRTALVSISVAGAVDEVSIFPTGRPSRVITSILTNGQDASTELKLPVTEAGFSLIQAYPAQYSFVIKKGGQVSSARVFCCQASIFPEHRVLTIRDLSSWEVTSR